MRAVEAGGRLDGDWLGGGVSSSLELELELEDWADAGIGTAKQESVAATARAAKGIRWRMRVRDGN
jgi:hypothetical protein